MKNPQIKRVETPNSKENQHFSSVSLVVDYYLLLVFISLGLFSTQQHAERAICYRKSVRPSICLFVTRVDQSKTVKVRIMQFWPYSSPIPLVFAVFSSRNSNGIPPSGGVKQGWVVNVIRRPSSTHGFVTVLFIEEFWIEINDDLIQHQNEWSNIVV